MRHRFQAAVVPIVGAAGGRNLLRASGVLATRMVPASWMTNFTGSTGSAPEVSSDCRSTSTMN